MAAYGWGGPKNIVTTGQNYVQPVWGSDADKAEFINDEFIDRGAYTNAIRKHANQVVAFEKKQRDEFGKSGFSVGDPLFNAAFLMGGTAIANAFGGAGSAASSAAPTAGVPAAAAPLTGGSVSGALYPTAAGAATGAAGAATGAAVSSLPKWVMPALQGGASILGGYMASESAEDAVNAQLAASRESLDYLRETRDLAIEQARPFQEAGVRALSAMERASGLGDEPYDITTDPGYQFRLDEGMRALEDSAFARGSGASGGAIRNALRYAQDYASNEYQNIYNRLANIAGYSTVAPASSQIYQNFGSNAANTAINAGEARGSGYIARGNAWQNALDQIAMMDWDSILKTA